MRDSDGAIANFESEADAKSAGFSVPLTEEEAIELGGRNRKERRAHLARMRKEKK